MQGRPEVEAFSGGPSYVLINFAWHTAVTGPIWVWYWGDGRLAPPRSWV